VLLQSDLACHQESSDSVLPGSGNSKKALINVIAADAHCCPEYFTPSFLRRQESLMATSGTPKQMPAVAYKAVNPLIFQQHWQHKRQH
jgi:hypothetical protein